MCLHITNLSDSSHFDNLRKNSANLNQCQVGYAHDLSMAKPLVSS